MQYLNLGHNNIQRIPSAISILQKLQKLELQNNSIQSDGLTTAITKLSLLRERNALDLSYNPVSMSLKWSNVDPSNALRILSYTTDSMKDLDLANGYFRLEHVIFILKNFTNLELLNVSFNRMEKFFFEDDMNFEINITNLKMFDISYNPITDLNSKIFFDLYVSKIYYSKR